MSDAGGVQVSTNLEASSESQTGNASVVCPQASQAANQVPWSAVAQEQHEDHVCNLPESPTPPW